MVVEEPSVVAAASNMARLVREAGGFTTEVDDSVMIGQVQLIQVSDPERVVARLEAEFDHLKGMVAGIHPHLEELGGGLIEVSTPRAEQVLGQGGIPVLIRFTRIERTAAESLRCLLNGIDVTQRLTLGGNGAAGSLWAPRDGPQTLRFEVFGQSWWRGPYFEDAVELTFEVRPNPTLDRADRPPAGAPRAGHDPPRD